MKINLTEEDYYYYKGNIMYVKEHLAFRRDRGSIKENEKKQLDKSINKDKYIKTLEDLILKHALKSIDNK